MAGQELIIFIRCDAGARIGFGHVSRCLSLARALRGMRACRVVFAMTSPDAVQRILGHGFDVAIRPEYATLEAWLKRVLPAMNPDVLILDAPGGFPTELAARSRREGRLVAVLDDAGPVRLRANVSYYPPVPTVRELDWHDASGEVLSGFPWVILGDRFRLHPSTGPASPSRLLLTMGGSDPAGLTLRAAGILGDPLLRAMAWDARIVTGPGFTRHKDLKAAIAGIGERAEVLRDPDDMGALMASCDLALVSFGVTAYELAASGKPAAHFCLTPEHARAADMFEREGMAISLGVHDGVDDESVARKLAALLSDPGLLLRMGSRAADLVDGNGAMRIAADILQRLEKCP